MNPDEGITPLILAGGLGTRLHSVIKDLPKVLAPVKGRPFLTSILDQLVSAEFTKAVVCTGFMADSVHTVIGQTYRNLSIQYSQEAKPLGTGGALRKALPLISSEVVMVLNGDSFIDADLGDFLRWFTEKGCDAALLLTRISDASRYGIVYVEPNGQISAFHEKNSNCITTYCLFNTKYCFQSGSFHAGDINLKKIWS